MINRISGRAVSNDGDSRGCRGHVPLNGESQIKLFSLAFRAFFLQQGHNLKLPDEVFVAVEFHSSKADVLVNVSGTIFVRENSVMVC